MATRECIVKSQLSKVFDYDIVKMQKNNPIFGPECAKLL